MGQFLSVYGLLALLTGYLLGSVPFGLILTKAAGAGDVREIGSGSIGATNVLRTGRKGLALATLLLDALKGFVAVLLVYEFALKLGIDAPGYGHRQIPDALFCSWLAGVGALLGHMFPVWLGFQGGKGVATFIGVLIGMNWMAAAWFGLVWVAVAAVARYSSLAALCATVGVILYYLVSPWVGMSNSVGIPFILAMAALIVLKHHANIRRLMEGRESKIGARSS
jgi:acyl phosphate:glycerol-3-phosphate acyltransferase